MKSEDKKRLVRMYNEAFATVASGTAGTEFNAGKAFGTASGLELGIEACGYTFRTDGNGYATGVVRIKEDQA